MAPPESERRHRSIAGYAGSPSRSRNRSSSEVVRERKLLRAARCGDRAARERLLRSRVGMIRSLAARYREFGLPFEDLVQEGSLGLLEAIEHFDPCRGTDFDSYARFRVRRAMRNALTDQARLIRLPKQIVERRRAIERAEAELTATKGRPATPEGLAAATNLSVAAVLEARTAGLWPISLDEPRLREGSPLEALLADPVATDPAEQALAHEQITLLNAALETLPERPRRVVMRKWGLDGSPRPTDELAGELELSPRRLQTIATDALYELRAVFQSGAVAP